LEFGAKKLLPLVKLWVSHVPRSAGVVDLGCGAGELLLAFSKLRFTNLRGCDLSAEQVMIAKQRFPEVVEKDLFSYLQEMPDDSLDIVTAFDVIEHLGPELTFRLFKELNRVLSPGGIFMAHCPNGVSPFVGSVYWGDMTHEWCLTPESAKTLCSLHGMVDFMATEHLGASSGLSGRIRSMCWHIIRGLLNVMNIIETGASQSVWTRNFAFCCKKITL
jgi:SAM-dependent methyltransferase